MYADRPQLRTLLVDLAFATAVTAFMVVGTFGAAGDDDLPAAAPLAPLTFLLIAVAGLALVVRRTWPLVALATTLAAVSCYLLIGYPYGPILFSIAITTYTVATLLPTSRSLPAWAVTAAILAVPFATTRDWDRPLLELAQLAAYTSWSLTAWAVGAAVRAVRRSAAATRAERLREQTYQERLRTAQDVHDTVGHGLAAITLQAGVALHVMDRSPARTREILETIRQSSQEALDELRVSLAAFRSPDDSPDQADDADVDRAPVPGLDRLDSLVRRTADSGVSVEVVRTGERARLPASVDQAAFRIVQESLTNVLRHARASTATVTVDYRPTELIVEVADTGRGPNGSAVTGHGLAGMRGRAAAVGGSLQTGPGPTGGFVVRARLPVR